ncbi:hypothetical protein [Streptomyces sp. NPDC003635]
MSTDADREGPTDDLGTWPLERLRALTAEGQWLEAVRVVAQGHAYDAGKSPQARREWAALSLLANRRQGKDTWGAHDLHDDFTLRMWVIDTLGPHPEWVPETLASDTLDALTLTPPEAWELAREWRALPIDRIRELRRHKNLTLHLERLMNHLGPGPTRDRLLPWIDVRGMLP